MNKQVLIYLMGFGLIALSTILIAVFSIPTLVIFPILALAVGCLFRFEARIHEQQNVNYDEGSAAGNKIAKNLGILIGALVLCGLVALVSSLVTL